MIALSWRGLVSFALVCGLVMARNMEDWLESIKETGRIKLVGSSDDSTHEGEFQKFCFTIGMEDKNKKIAYQQTIQKLNKVQRYFKIKDVIPNEGSLTVKRVEARLNRKRRVWAVLKTVCFLSEIDQQKFIQGSLRQMGIRQFRAYPIGSLLNERQLATKAFNNAKSEATKILSKIDYKILKVSNIEILGDYVYQEERLEEEIEDEFNQGEDSQEDRLSSGEHDDEMSLPSQDVGDSMRLKLEDIKPIKISVIFEVGPEDQDESTSTIDVDQDL